MSIVYISLKPRAQGNLKWNMYSTKHVTAWLCMIYFLIFLTCDGTMCAIIMYHTTCEAARGSFHGLSSTQRLKDNSKCYFHNHNGDVIMDAMASQITSLTIVYSTVYSDADQRKHQSSASLAFVRGIHRGPVNSPHKWPVTRKYFHLMTSSWR